MDDEEYLRNRLDMINRNSVYGIQMLDVDQAEIAKIVHDYIERLDVCNEYYRLTWSKPPIYIRPVKVKSLKERLEETAMHADCEFCVKRDICTRDVPKPCNYRYTEDERRADQASDIYGCILAGMYLPKTYQKKKEENEMEPTSVWEIENIDEISITQDGDEISLLLKNRDDLTKITLTGDAIKNHNDNFITTLKVDMEDDANTRFEQEQKIKKLEKELGEWKKEAADCLKLRDEVRREKNKEINKLKQLLQQVEHDKKRLTWENEQLKQENECKCESCSAGISYAEMYRNMQDKLETANKQLQEKNENLKKHVQFQIDNYNDILTNNHKLREDNRHLKKELALEKAANEAQHKFIREYAGKGTEVQFNYAIDDTKGVSYVIVEKNRELAEENEKLKKENEDLKKHTVAKALEYIEMNNKLRDENEELKYQLSDIQATKEVVEQKLNTRAGILDQAKKCVCGQREQDYGTPESNFQLIADLWNGYLGFMDHPQDQIRATDVSMMMSLMKIARIRNGGGSGDSFVDLAGYAACGGEIWHSNKGTN